MKPPKFLDLKGKVCPYTHITTLKTLREIEAGGLLKVTVDNEESLEGIVTAVKNAGHQIDAVSLEQLPFTVTIKKNHQPGAQP